MFQDHTPSSALPFSISRTTIVASNGYRISSNTLPLPPLFFRRFFGNRQIVTANPANVQHILKTNFPNYHKGQNFRQTFRDFMGDGIFNSDGETWKFQRQVSSHEFNTKSLRRFVEHVVDAELNERLIPILSSAAVSEKVLDFQDILQRFAFDNMCRIAFGYDPGYLLPSLPEADFPASFESSVRIISERFNSVLPLTWKIKRLLGIGSEKQLKLAIAEVRDFAKRLVREKKQLMITRTTSSLASADLLSRFLKSGHSDEDFITDIVISFILAGRDTTSAALTWFFWLISKHPEVEDEILKETSKKSEAPVYDEVKNMVYTHAALYESMRLYPPVPVDTKTAVNDDVLPDGTPVKKGTRVAYHPYAMGRSAAVWGEDWAEFRLERWVKREKATEEWGFEGRDPYSYPIFQAGPRICLGKDMAFLQMKRVVARVLWLFKVVSATLEGEEPVFISDLTTKMEGGFPVRIMERER